MRVGPWGRDGGGRSRRGFGSRKEKSEKEREREEAEAVLFELGLLRGGRGGKRFHGMMSAEEAQLAWRKQVTGTQGRRAGGVGQRGGERVWVWLGWNIGKGVAGRSGRVRYLVRADRN